MNVFPSQIAGTWYPGDARELAHAIDGFLDCADGAPDESLRALVVPHAGVRYSGKAAGAGYARVPRGRFRRVVLLAPSHYHHFEGGAVFTGDGFETPLGTVAVDPSANELAGAPGFVATAAPYAREHAVEIQLPFLQRIDAELRLVPVLVGSEKRLADLTPGLRSLQDDETLFVVSSDFTHYGAAFDYLPFPPSNGVEVAAHLRELDSGAIEPVCRVDPEAFESYVRTTGITVCGRAPIGAFLRACPAGLEGSLVSYYTSLDVTGDFEHSVSYAAIAFRRVSAS